MRGPRSRRLRNHIVTKGRCRQAPRQRVASHNTHSCLQAASATRWASRPCSTVAHTSLCAHARVLRMPTQLRARCAPTQEPSHVHLRRRLGLTLRVQAEPASLPLQSQQKNGQQEHESRHPAHHRPERESRLRRACEQASPSGRCPDTPERCVGRRPTVTSDWKERASPASTHYQRPRTTGCPRHHSCDRPLLQTALAFA